MIASVHQRRVLARHMESQDAVDPTNVPTVTPTVHRMLFASPTSLAICCVKIHARDRTHAVPTPYAEWTTDRVCAHVLKASLAIPTTTGGDAFEYPPFAVQTGNVSSV